MTSGTAASPPDAASPVIWVLLGRRTGDNRQLMALADATGLVWVPKPLAFADLTKRRTIPRAGSLDALSAESRASLAAPWPEVVLAAGRWSAPVALAIRAASGGRTRLVHVGRPWAPLGWFDLVVTTAQYGLPARPNVATNCLPLTAPAVPDPMDAALGALPRPRLTVLVGGDSPPRRLDAAAARALAAAALARAAEDGGSLLVATSPRTSPEVAAALREVLADATVPVRLSIFGEGENAYRAFLAAADGFLVTDDSAAMAAEAALAGAPVTLHALPRRPTPSQRRVAALKAAAAATAATRALFDRLVDRGIVTSIRDLDRFFDGLRADDLLSGGDAARLTAARERERTADRVRRLAAGARTS